MTAERSQKNPVEPKAIQLEEFLIAIKPTLIEKLRELKIHYSDFLKNPRGQKNRARRNALADAIKNLEQENLPFGEHSKIIAKLLLANIEAVKLHSLTQSGKTHYGPLQHDILRMIPEHERAYLVERVITDFNKITFTPPVEKIGKKDFIVHENHEHDEQPHANKKFK